MTITDCLDAIGALVERCPHMHRAYDAVGRPPDRDWGAGFATLFRIICDQQISNAAGAAIRRGRDQGSGGGGVGTRGCRLGAGGGGGTDSAPAASVGPRPALCPSWRTPSPPAGWTWTASPASTTRPSGPSSPTCAASASGPPTSISCSPSVGPTSCRSRDMAVAAGAQRLMGLRDRPRPKELKELARAWPPVADDGRPPPLGGTTGSADALVPPIVVPYPIRSLFPSPRGVGDA